MSCILQTSMAQRFDNLRSPLAMTLFFGTTIVGLALDLWTKTLAVANLDTEVGARTYPFIPGWLHFTFTRNHGAVFGLGQGQRWLFIIVSLAAIGFLTYLFILSEQRRFYQLLLGMLLAGVLGNMYDRITYGYVRDMIFALPETHWPAWIQSMLPGGLAHGTVFPWVFNVADSLLCVGVFLMIVYSLIHQPERRPEAPQEHERLQPQTNPRQ